MSAPTTGTSRSSDRVLTLLAAVVDGGRQDGTGGSTLTQLAEAVDLAPSTTSRQLASLEGAGFVTRTATGYRPGPRLIRLSHRVVGGHPLPLLAQDTLDLVAQETGETTYLAAAHDEDTAIYIAAAEGRMTLRVAGWRGRDVPRQGTAVGEALSGRVAVGDTAVGRDTVEEGITGVSGPVVDVNGDVVAAVSVLGPTFRLTGEALVVTKRMVSEGAGTISSLLGGNP